MNPDVIKQFDGYDKVADESAFAKKHGVDYAKDRGVWERLINRLHPPKLDLRVSEIIDETPTVKTIRLVPEEGPLPPFQAGQYIAIVCEVDGIRTCRPYSISSPPNQTGYYDVTVRRVDGRAGFEFSFGPDETRRPLGKLGARRAVLLQSPVPG